MAYFNRHLLREIKWVILSFKSNLYNKVFKCLRHFKGKFKEQYITIMH